MNAAEFKQSYRLSDALPMDPSARAMDAMGFAYALEEFLNGNFRGLLEVSCTANTGQKVLVCPEYVAFYFKTLLTYVHGRIFLKIIIESTDKHLTVRVESDEPLPLTYEETNNLIRAARNGGLQVYMRDEGMFMTLRFSDAARHRLYAISLRDGRRSMLASLDEIFFCGMRITGVAPTVNPRSKKAQPKRRH